MGSTDARGRTHPQPLIAPIVALGPTTPKPDKSLNELANFMYDFEKEAELAFTPRAFDIIPAYTYLPFIKYSLICLIVLFLVFEMIKRTFYYIVLGGLFPKKTE